MSRSTSKTSRQSGRILIHERDVDDNAPIIGGEEENNNELGDAYETEFHDTISKNMEDDTRKDYRRRLVCIANYWEQHCPVYYCTGVKVVPETDYGDRDKFYFNGRYNKDLVYAGLNVKFLSSV